MIPKNPEVLVPELVRVMRDGSAIIVKTEDGSYIRTSSDGASERNTSDRIGVLTAGGGWRRVTSEDLATYNEATILASGKVFVEESEPRSRVYRVPPTVQKSIKEALETYSPVMSDADREVAGRLASQTQVEKSDIEWMDRFFSVTEKALALHGGRRGQNWARKVLSADEPVTADGGPPTMHTAFDEEDVLFVAGTDEEVGTDLFDTLYMVDPEDGSVYVWEMGDFTPLDLKDGEIEREYLQEIDPESARELAFRLDSEPAKAYALADLFPEERNLFSLAEAELDFEYLSLLADATGYSAPERSANAHRQPRAAGHGRFSKGSPEPIGQTTEAFAKARVSEDLPLVEDAAGLVAAHVDGPVVAAAHTTKKCETESCPRWALRTSGTCLKHTSPGALTAAAESAPLYLAIVDTVDKTAVLDVVSIAQDESGNATGWRREGGQWVPDEEIVADLRGDTPPPLVELTDESLLKDVLAQVDKHDGEEEPAETTEEDVMQASAAELADYSTDERDKLAKKGYALPDGSFPIKNVEDLENAVQAYGRASDKEAARKHIRKRARALNRADLIPDSWRELAAEEPVVAADLFGPYGEVLVASGIPGVADTPEDFRNVERLKRYWTTGPGGLKIRWGTPGDLTRAARYLRKYVGKDAYGLAQNLHKRIFGMTNAERDKKVGH